MFNSIKVLHIICKIFIISFVLYFFSSCKKADESPNSIVSPNQVVSDSIIMNICHNARYLIDDKYEFQRALDQLQETKATDAYKNSTPSSKGFLCHMLGVSHYKLGNYFDACEFAEEALSFKKVDRITSDSSRARSYLLKSESLSDLHEYELARVAIEVAIDLINRNPTYSNFELNYHVQLAMCYLRLGYDNKAKIICEFVLRNSPNLKQKSNVLYYLSELNQNSDKSAELQFESLELSKILGDSLLILLNEFEISLRGNSNLEIIQNYKERLAKYKFSKFLRSDILESSYNNIAYLYLQEGNGNKAEEYYFKNLELSKAQSSPLLNVNVAQCYEGLGDVALLKRNYIQSIEYYHESIKHLCSNFDSDDIFSVPDIKINPTISILDLHRITGFKIQALTELYKDTKEVNHLKYIYVHLQFLDELVSHKRRLYQDESRFQLLSENEIVYDQLVTKSLELHRITQEKKYLHDALNYASKNKAIVLLDDLNIEEIKASKIPKVLLESEDRLRKEIIAVENNLSFLLKHDINYSQKRDSILDLTYNLNNELNSLIRSYDNNYNEYYELKFSYSDSIDIKQIRQKLDFDEAIIEYRLRNNKLQIFAIDKNTGLSYFESQLDSSEMSSLRNWALVYQNNSNISIEEYSKEAHKLFQILLSKCLLKINNTDHVKKITIIPDAILSKISFENLHYELNETKEWTNIEIPYVLNKFEISYSFNIRLWLDAKTRKISDSLIDSYIGFGLDFKDYNIDSTINYPLLQRDTLLRSKLGKLEFSTDEIKESSNIFGGRYYLNEDATKNHFIANADDGEIIHIASHGFADELSPLESGIVLFDSDSSDNGLLSAKEIYNIETNAEMAILSACHSGYGKLEEGEGVRSLARAFQFSGCQNVTASLWGANDYSTKLIVVKYLELIKEGYSKSKALQLSKQHYLNNVKFESDAHPMKWSHLISIGNQKPINFEKSFWSWFD